MQIQVGEQDEWIELVKKSEVLQTEVNSFILGDDLSAKEISHIRVRIEPNGGFSRIKVMGKKA